MTRCISLGRLASLILVSVASGMAAAQPVPVAPVRIPATAPVSALPAADAFFTDPALGETRALIVIRDGQRIY